MKGHWLDRATALFSPEWALRRMRARMATEMVQRSYDAASSGRRTQGWRRTLADANNSVGPNGARLRDVARDLVRNNPYAESALSTIVDHTVGWGIVPTERLDAFDEWSQTTACDADGRHDLAGLQKLVMRTTVEAGEVLVRRRWRRPTDGLPLPLQLQILEPDYLDTSKQVDRLQNGGRIVYGVEFDAIGRRVAYWVLREHPGSNFGTTQSDRVPASELLHVGRGDRPGQVRFASWFSPVLLRFKDFDEFEDATLMKQKVAACLSVLISDVDGSAAPLGDTTSDSPDIDLLSPGLIKSVPPGQTIEVVEPPSAGDYKDFSQTTLRAIATGLGVSYEDLTGDYNNLPFSAARMSRLRHWDRVDDWRYRLLIPQFLDPVWRWAMEAAGVMGLPTAAKTNWTPPPMPMLEPDKEGLAIMRNIRAGITTFSEAIRERGHVPEVFLAEYAADLKKLDALGIVLDSDARQMTQQGLAQVTKDESSETPPAASR